MSAAKGNGQIAENNLPAKKHSKHATDFKATCARFANGFYVSRSIDLEHVFLLVLVMVMGVFL